MRSIFYLLRILGLFLFFSVDEQAMAFEPKIVQKDELSRLVIDVNNAVKNRNFVLIPSYMPDRLYKEMANRLKTTEDDLRNSFLKQLHVQFEKLPADSYYLDEENIEYFQTSKGTSYALIPTTLETNDRIIQYKTLAIFDKTQWYLIYGGHKTLQNPIFLEIYPDLNKINLPKEIIIEK